VARPQLGLGWRDRIPLLPKQILHPLDAVGVAAIAALLVYEHSLVKPTDLARVNAAFFNVNAAVSMGLLAIGAVALWF
jgi:4-hydroxybenzoate polyprenyltransferase